MSTLSHTYCLAKVDNQFSFLMKHCWCIVIFKLNIYSYTPKPFPDKTTQEVHFRSLFSMEILKNNSCLRNVQVDYLTNICINLCMELHKGLWPTAGHLVQTIVTRGGCTDIFPTTLNSIQGMVSKYDRLLPMQRLWPWPNIFHLWLKHAFDVTKKTSNATLQIPHFCTHFLFFLFGFFDSFSPFCLFRSSFCLHLSCEGSRDLGNLVIIPEIFQSSITDKSHHHFQSTLKVNIKYLYNITNSTSFPFSYTSKEKMFH